MRSFTTAELLQATIQGDLGAPVTRAANRDQGTAVSPALFTVPSGQVALVTGITLQGGTGKSGVSSAYQPSPAVSFVGITAGTYGAAAFLSFRRPETHFMGTSTPTARAAPPGNVVKWKPKHPIPLPSIAYPGLAVVGTNTLGDFGNHACLDMVWVASEHAASLGIDVSGDNTKSRHQFKSQLVTSVATALQAGRKGMHFRIKDMYIRLQPGVPGTANTLRIYQRGNTANNGDNVEVDIWRFVNDNIVDAIDIPFSPDEVFLRNGADLFASCTISNSATITVSGVFEDPDQCESDCFFSSLNPAFPGTSATAVPTGFGNARKLSAAFQLYYPKTNTTKTTPGVGFQHLVRGLSCSVQKKVGRFYSAGATMVVDQTLFTISQGATSGGVAFTLIGETQPNVQIMPTLYATEHNQNVLLVDDSKNAVCKPDDGQIWFNSFNFDNDGTLGGALFDVTTADADISAWGFSVWGRTIPQRFRTPDQLGV